MNSELVFVICDRKNPEQWRRAPRKPSLGPRVLLHSPAPGLWGPLAFRASKAHGLEVGPPSPLRQGALRLTAALMKLVFVL